MNSSEGLQEERDYLNTTDVTAQGVIKNAKKRKNKQKEETRRKSLLKPIETSLFEDHLTVDIAPVDARKPMLNPPKYESENEYKTRKSRAFSALEDGLNLSRKRDRPVTPKITRNQVIPLLEKIVELLDEDSYRGKKLGPIKLPINSSMQQPCSSSPKVHHMQQKPGSIEIQPNSRVYVDQAELQFYARWVDRPGEIVRRLMLNIVGERCLKTMSALGKRKRRGIPPHILEAVKYFVDETIGYEMGFSDYVTILNQQCNTLRHPHVTDPQRSVVGAARINAPN